MSVAAIIASQSATTLCFLQFSHKGNKSYTALPRLSALMLTYMPLTLLLHLGATLGRFGICQHMKRQASRYCRQSCSGLGRQMRE